MEIVCLADANLYDKRIQLTSLASLGIGMTESRGSGNHVVNYVIGESRSEARNLNFLREFSTRYAEGAFLMMTK
jgi:hypothetical protein